MKTPCRKERGVPLAKGDKRSSSGVQMYELQGAREKPGTLPGHGKVLTLTISMPMKNVAGLILAAGKSERMGRSKAMLAFRGSCFLTHIMTEASGSNLADVKVILGHSAEAVLQTLPEIAPNAWVNPGYEAGQLSSLQCGLRHLNLDGVNGVMVFLIDHPFIHRRLINQLIEAFAQNDASIVIPSFERRRGHPIIFGAGLFSELLSAPLDQGAVSVVRKHLHEILHLDVDEPGVLIDIDTPEAYEKHVVRLGQT